jgi:hypothetical protein
MKAGKYVEPEEVKLEVGKWYQWYQSDHSNTHIGKCLTINKDNVSMSPWIIGRTTYGEEGSFHPRCIEEIIELPESEVQQYLPKEVKEWSEGTYVVIIDNYHSVDIGDVHKIGFNIFKDCIDIEESVGKTCFPNKDCCKWFATKQEAEEFAKTLKEPIKYLDDKNRPLKEFKVGSWYSNPKITWVSLTNGNKAKFFKIAKCEVKLIDNYYYNSICFDAHADSDWNIEANNREQSNAGYDQDMAEVFPVVKSKRYIKTMEFFNQLREPEKSQAIANYDEEFNNIVPDDLEEALCYGFNFYDNDSNGEYWDDILLYVSNGTYFKDPKPTQEAVHCPTQEEFDYVTEKLGYELISSNPFDKYPTDGCVKIGHQCYGRKDDFKTYTILTFQEWCAKYNHEGLKPWVAKVGDWIVLLESIQGFEVGKPYPVTDIRGDRLWVIQGMNCQIDRKYYRKATQAEIDSVTKPTEVLGLPITKDVVWTQWTHDNWYVEVSSQEEANMVINAAAKMYGKKLKRLCKYSENWKYVSWHNHGYFVPLNTKNLSKLANPRSISDFITVSDSSRLTEDPHLRRLDKPYQQYPLTPSESFKVKSNPKLLDNNVSKISSINISLKQKSKSKKL